LDVEAGDLLMTRRNMEWVSPTEGPVCPSVVARPSFLGERHRGVLVDFDRAILIGLMGPYGVVELFAG
jgi:hypothetical protein